MSVIKKNISTTKQNYTYINEYIDYKVCQENLKIWITFVLFNLFKLYFFVFSQNRWVSMGIEITKYNITSSLLK